MKSALKSFSADQSGQFAIMFSVIAAIFMVCMVVAIDYTNMVRSRSKIIAIADSAALAGATAAHLSDRERKAIVRDFIKANGHTFLPATINGEPDIDFDDTKEEVRVEILTNLPMFFGRLGDKRAAPVSGASTVSYVQQTINPITIAFALDVSGSMGGRTSDNRIKLNVLKVSIRDLFLTIEGEIEQPDKLDLALRSGMTTYNTGVVGEKPMDWGWRHLQTSVKAMTAYGGTNSVPALSNAYQQILDDRIFRANNDPKFKLSDLRESVIFMTDGDNNQPEWDTESIELCEKMRADGIELYSVAFAAPHKGRGVLIDCASWDDKQKDARSDRGNGNSRRYKCYKDSAGQTDDWRRRRCKGKKGKKRHYFDAENGKEFRETFRNIGKEIAKRNVRIKS